MDNRSIIKQFTDSSGEVDMVAVVRERQRRNKVYQAKHIAEGKHKTDINLYRRYRSGAKKRGIYFLLSPCEFASFLHKPCHYCGKENCIGIDRRDSSGGYIEDNMVPCCPTCNRMKMAIGEMEFIAQCQRIADHTRQ